MKTNRSKINHILAMVALAGVSLSCSFFKEKLNGSGTTNEFAEVAGKLKNYDYKLHPPSPGALVIRQLAVIDPGLTHFAAEIEKTEHGATKQMIDAIPVTSVSKKSKTIYSSQLQLNNFVPTALANPGIKIVPSAAVLMLQNGQIELPGSGDGILVGGFAGFLKGMLSEVREGGFNKKDSKTETNNGTTSVMDSEIGRNQDGSTVFGMGLKSESVKNGVKVTTELRARIEGQDCPNAAGQVPITVKMHLSGASGSSRYEQDITVFIRIVVGENGTTESKTFDITQSTSRGGNGRDVYVESGETATYTYGSNDDITISNRRVIQKTDNLTTEESNDLSESGKATAYGAAHGAVTAAERVWENGGCMKIEATSPGTVEPGSAHSIPVKVISRDDGSEIAAKLDAVLNGETSVDPAVIPKTSGTLTYVAPGESGKTATISLTARSRRGIAKLDLKAITGGYSYQVVGGLDDWQTDTKVCDIMKPFTLTGIVNMKFSGGLSGTYEYSGGPFNMKGKGTYSISLPNGVGQPGTMTGSGPGQVTGDKVYTGSGTEKYTLTPIEPCS